MPRIISPVEAIDHLVIQAWKPSGRVMRGVDVIFVSDRNCIIRGPDNTLYIRALGNAAYMPGIYNWTKTTLDGLVSLGVITRKAASDHIRACQAHEDAQAKLNDLSDFEQSARRIGVKLTAAQRAAARRLRRAA